MNKIREGSRFFPSAVRLLKDSYPQMHDLSG
jgi:hypothetical protein